LLQRLARANFGTNNIDIIAPRDYNRIDHRAGRARRRFPLTMEQLYQSKAFWLVGNDPTNQNPLVGMADSQRGFAITAHSSSSSIR